MARSRLSIVAVLSLALPSLQYGHGAARVTVRHAPLGRPCLIRAASTAEAEAAEIDQPQELNVARLTQGDGTLRREEIASLKAAQGPEATAMCLQEHLVANPGDADALIELGNVWFELGLGMTAAESNPTPTPSPSPSPSPTPSPSPSPSPSPNQA